MVGENRQQDYGTTAPGLRATVYYQRPIERGDLLGSLASLGVFVSEHEGAPGPRRTVPEEDLFIVVARGAIDRELIARLAVEPPVLVVVVPTRPAAAGMLDAGATFCLTDDDLRRSPRAALLMAARLARHARAATHSPTRQPDGLVWLGNVLFSADACALVNKGERLPLSRAERDVLLRLALAPGVPVRFELLADAAQIRTFPTSRYLSSVILHLRRKLQQLGSDGLTVATVRGVGYVLLGSDAATPDSK